MLFDEKNEQDFTGYYETIMKQQQAQQAPCLKEDHDLRTGLNDAFFPQTQLANLRNIRFENTHNYECLPGDSHPLLNEGKAPFQTNNSTTFENNVLSENPEVVFNSGFLHIIPSDFPSSSKDGSKLVLSEAIVAPAVLTDDKIYPPLPSLRPAKLEEINGSNHTQGFPTQTLIHSIKDEHTKSATKSLKTGLNYPNIDLWNAQQRYKTFEPLIPEINGHNFKDFLVKVLNECLHEVSLDDFYNLLYNSESPDQVIISPTKGCNIDKSKPSDSQREALNFCALILNSLRVPDLVGGLIYLNQNLQCVNYLEICRNFLAIKILFASVKLVNDSVNPGIYLLRVEVYKAYYTICKRLERKYPKSEPKSQSNIILNQSQLGKIIKLKFPNLPSKRYGSRSWSKYYYAGMVWNDLVIDKEIKRLIELPLPDLISHFGNFRQKRVKKKSKPQYGSYGNQIYTSLSTPSQRIQQLEPLKRKPMHSFVDLSSTLPVLECFPRAWKIVPGEIPQQSKWAKETMEKSVEFLKKQNIDITPLIFKIGMVEFSADSMASFLDDVLLQIRNLTDISASDELFLHIYLVVSTLIFPIVFASDSEVLSSDKVKLRTLLNHFVTKLESSFVDIPEFENLMSFANIIKRMISFNTLILARYKISSIKDILRAMIDESPPISSSGKTSIKNLIIKQSTIVCHAFDWDFIDENSKKSTMSHSIVVQNITKAYTKLFMGASEWFSLLGESLDEGNLSKSTYDLLFHILKGALEVLHKRFLSETEILKLPIKLIENFLVSMNSEFQKSSFQNYAKRENGLSNEVFKTWWVHSSAFQDYMGIFAEISALSVRLS